MFVLLALGAALGLAVEVGVVVEVGEATAVGLSAGQDTSNSSHFVVVFPAAPSNRSDSAKNLQGRRPSSSQRHDSACPR